MGLDWTGSLNHLTIRAPQGGANNRKGSIEMSVYQRNNRKGGIEKSVYQRNNRKGSVEMSVYQ